MNASFVAAKKTGYLAITPIAESAAMISQGRRRGFQRLDTRRRWSRQLRSIQNPRRESLSDTAQPAPSRLAARGHAHPRASASLLPGPSPVRRFRILNCMVGLATMALSTSSVRVEETTTQSSYPLEVRERDSAPRSQLVLVVVRREKGRGAQDGAHGGADPNRELAIASHT